VSELQFVWGERGECANNDVPTSRLPTPPALVLKASLAVYAEF